MFIPIGGTKGKGLFFQIDEEDYQRVSQHGWSFSTFGYIKAGINGKCIYLHRFLLNPPDEIEIDHINRDKLDNRSVNLRLASRSLNCLNVEARKDNKFGCRGVSYFKPRGTYVARIQIENKRRIIGYFKTVEEAVEARMEALDRYLSTR